MKIKFKIIVTLFLIAFLSIQVYAGKTPIPFSWDGERIEKIHDLPNTSNFQTPNFTYVDIGIVYKQIVILFIPIWNYDKRYCGYIDSNELYLPLTDMEIKGMALSAGTILEETPPVTSWWHSWGGKLLFLIILFFVIIGNIDSEETTKKENEKSFVPDASNQSPIPFEPSPKKEESDAPA